MSKNSTKTIKIVVKKIKNHQELNKKLSKMAQKCWMKKLQKKCWTISEDWRNLVKNSQKIS